MRTHTPGPWKVKTPGAAIFAKSGKMIATARTGLDNDRENAVLIAAAPDLLAALRQAVTDCPCSVRERECGHRLGCRAPQWECVIDRAEGLS